MVHPAIDNPVLLRTRIPFAPFYSQYNVSEETFSKYRVTWKRLSSKMSVVVLSNIKTDFGSKSLISTTVTSFIPTNLISITDGQIYLERGLFQKGFLPAINVGLSVSRVGSQAQPKPLKEVVGGIRLALAQHKELQKLVQLESITSVKSQERIYRGNLILELLKQEKHTRVSWPEQVVLFYTVEQGFFDNVSKEKWKNFERLLLELMRNRYWKVLENIEKGIFNEETKKEIQKIIKDFKQEFLEL